MTKKNLLVTSLFFLFTTYLLCRETVVVSAKDKCADIKDLDDRAKCYEDKIEDKQKDYQSTSTKLSSIRDKKNLVSSSISQYLNELNVTQAQINTLQTDIDDIKQDLDEINEGLADRKGKLEEKTSFRNQVIRNYAKRQVSLDLEIFFTSFPFKTGFNGFQYSSYSDMYKKILVREAEEIIYILNSEIDNFEKDKQEGEKLKFELEDTQASLLSLKADIDAKKASAQAEYSNLEDKEGDYKEDLEDLEKEIADLSAKQQAVIQAKSGDFSASLSDGVETDDSRTSASYKPGFSPAFGVFSYGAYTHRKGMSQYGAKGRAEKGQGYKDILKFYYKTGIKDKGLDKICVEGYGNMDIQKYLYGLAEMPDSWDEDALKAQAVAGRSYAYRYIKSGKCICTSQNCQVFSKSKSDNPPSRWKKAVDDTKDEVLDSDVVAYYSSTTGGYINDIGWDTYGSWPNDAYEKKGGSPWFYKAWFTKDYTKSSSTCGRDHPWLTGEEMADILNAYVLLKAGKNTERILPETINKCPIGGMGGKPYSKDDLRQKAESAGKGFKKASGVKNISFGNGYTKQLTFETDKGDYTVDGQVFMKAFNLRAPGYIAIKYTPDTKGLFDVLKK